MMSCFEGSHWRAGPQEVPEKTPVLIPARVKTDLEGEVVKLASQGSKSGHGSGAVILKVAQVVLLLFLPRAVS